MLIHHLIFRLVSEGQAEKPDKYEITGNPVAFIRMQQDFLFIIRSNSYLTILSKHEISDERGNDLAFLRILQTNCKTLFMNSRNTNFLLVILMCLVIFSCKQEKKSETSPEIKRKAATAVLARTRYTIGDSISIGFSQPVAQFEVTWNGAVISDAQQVSDSVFIRAVSEKTGWKQLIVNGVTKTKETFADRDCVLRS